MGVMVEPMRGTVKLAAGRFEWPGSGFERHRGAKRIFRGHDGIVDDQTDGSGEAPNVHQVEKS